MFNKKILLPLVLIGLIFTFSTVLHSCGGDVDNTIRVNVSGSTS